MRTRLAAVAKLFGRDHELALRTMGNFAITLYGIGDLAGAESLQRKVLGTRTRLKGETHATTLAAKGHLASTLYAGGSAQQLAAAEELQRAVAGAREKARGP